MRLWKTLVLALVLGGLVAYIYKVELPAETEKKRAESVFQGVENNSIEKIVVKNAEDEFALTNKSPAPLGASNATFSEDPMNAWELEGYPKGKLDAGVVTPILNAITELKYGNKIPTEEVEPPSMYGLDNPPVVVKISVAGKETALNFGKRNEYAKKYYMSVTGSEGIYLVTPPLVDAVSKKRQDFRSKTPFSFSEAGIETITFAGSHGVSKFQQSGKGDWKILEPGPYRADSVAVNGMMRELRNLSVTDFVNPESADKPVDLSLYGLSNAALKIKISYTDSSKKGPLSFGFGKSNAGEIYGNVEGVPSLFKLSKDAFIKLDKRVDDFRIKEYFRFGAGEAEKITFEDAGKDPLVLNKTGEEWTVNGKPADRPFVEELVKTISGLKAVAYPRSARDYGLNEPRLKITAVLDVNESQKIGERIKKEVVLKIGGPAPSNEASVDGKEVTTYYAEVSEISEVFMISEGSLKMITPRLDALVKPDTSPSLMPKSGES